MSEFERSGLQWDCSFCHNVNSVYSHECELCGNPYIETARDSSKPYKWSLTTTMSALNFLPPPLIDLIVSYMIWLRNETIGDKLDARDSTGTWLQATVIGEKPDSDKLLLHFDSWPSVYDLYYSRFSRDLAPFRTFAKTATPPTLAHQTVDKEPTPVVLSLANLQ